MSLRHKLFISYAVISLLLLGIVFALVELRVRDQVSSDTLAELRRTENAFREHWEGMTEQLGRGAAIVADAPRLKAAVDTADEATIRPVAEDYRTMIGVDLFELHDPAGLLLAGFSGGGVYPYQKLSLPIAVGPSLLGTLTVGHRLDETFAARMKRLVNAEIAVFHRDRLVTSTLPPERRAPLLDLGDEWEEKGPIRLRLAGESYLALAVGEPGLAGTRFVVLRSLDESLRLLGAVRRDLLVLGCVMTALALAASYATARTLTRPLADIVEGMSEMARSGDLSREIRLRSRDKEAHLLATTFHHLTRALLAFQKESEHKEKLTSLGRLSATLAHEIRNPLTIIKGSALQILDEGDPGPEVAEAAQDILQEVDRLNRLVDSVLHSARPASYELQEVDIHQICRESLAAVADDGRIAVETFWDPALGRVRVDPARLKQVLLNVLLNARDAVSGAGTIRMRTEADAESYAIVVSDDGMGIPEEDLGKIFDPFFTRKSSGTGLGLSVARNLVEGLGGEIRVHSAPERGTMVTIRLPFAPRGPAVVDSGSASL